MSRFVLLDGRPIPFDRIGLDDLDWDHGHVHGNTSLVLHLEEGDLRALGEALMEFLAEILAEDPEYFTGHGMAGIPVPVSSDLFVEDPAVLMQYLRDGRFWSRDLVIALLDHVAPDRVPGGSDQRDCRLVELRSVVPLERSAILAFGVWGRKKPMRDP